MRPAIENVRTVEPVAYDMDFVHLVEVRDGRVVRFQEFFDTWTAAQAFLGVLVPSS
jgi:ketosteroid isomerase-like protein